METAVRGHEPRSRSLDGEIDRLVALYRRAGRSLRAQDPANWAEGLTMPQLRVLFYLGRSGPVSVGQLASGLGISQPSATETIDKLACKGLLERSADSADRRVVRTTLTEKGKEMIDRPWETRRAVLASALRDASPAERAAIEQGLALLCDALEKAERELRES
ncbi:MAG TPA: MarR family transcriptional regulator [Chloroflexota bacterium]|nr:MarR family transcriptional regulator [Chloroflexota bacterium]